MSRLKGIIFDFNGTLLWDTPYHNKAWNIFLDRYHISLSDQEIRDNMHGRTNAEIFKYLFKKDLSQSEVDSLASEKEAIYRHLIINNNFDLHKGSRQMFDFCLACAIPTSIATSSDQENATFFYERYNLKTWFSQRRFIYNDYTFASKPAPDIFKKAANQMFLEPDEIMVFEDSPAGIEAAENFGAGKIVVINSTGEDLNESPYLVLDSFLDAINIIDLNIVLSREGGYIFE
ncbi:MAG: HAD family phosphatase [Bacteroidales bacterium]|nr:HAD family phosphatase [Bacteroidales bacterium]